MSERGVGMSERGCTRGRGYAPSTFASTNDTAKTVMMMSPVFWVIHATILNTRMPPIRVVPKNHSPSPCSWASSMPRATNSMHLKVTRAIMTFTMGSLYLAPATSSDAEMRRDGTG